MQQVLAGHVRAPKPPPRSSMDPPVTESLRGLAAAAPRRPLSLLLSRHFYEEIIREVRRYPVVWAEDPGSEVVVNVCRRSVRALPTLADTQTRRTRDPGAGTGPCRFPGAGICGAGRTLQLRSG